MMLLMMLQDSHEEAEAFEVGAWPMTQALPFWTARRGSLHGSVVHAVPLVVLLVSSHHRSLRFGLMQ